MSAVATAPRPNPRVVYRDLADGGVLLHLDSGQYHSLNATGALIWKLIDGARTPPQIIDGLRAQLESSPDDLSSVVADFLDGLLTRDLIVA